MLDDEKTQGDSEIKAEDTASEGQQTEQIAEKPAIKETKQEETQKPKSRAESRIQQLVSERNEFREKASTLEKEISQIKAKNPAADASGEEDRLGKLEETIQSLQKDLSQERAEKKKEESAKEAEKLFEQQIDAFTDAHPDISEAELDIISSVAAIGEDGIVDFEGAYKKLEATFEARKSKPAGGGLLKTSPGKGQHQANLAPSKLSPADFDNWAKSQLQGKL